MWQRERDRPKMKWKLTFTQVRNEAFKGDCNIMMNCFLLLAYIMKYSLGKRNISRKLFNKLFNKFINKQIFKCTFSHCSNRGAKATHSSVHLLCLCGCESVCLTVCVCVRSECVCVCVCVEELCALKVELPHRFNKAYFLCHYSKRLLFATEEYILNPHTRFRFFD